MPMMTDGRNTGPAISAGIPLAGQSLRVGGEYQEYWLADWWPLPARACGHDFEPERRTARTATLLR
ncbi:MAG: hypothetical protein IPJ97_18230 [Proteobacteria bacterium]|nr:hypothetical protein [Pseudomonadota bacterium]